MKILSRDSKMRISLMRLEEVLGKDILEEWGEGWVEEEDSNRFFRICLGLGENRGEV